MTSIIISLIPATAVLLIGALVWYTDPWVRAQRALRASSQCVACGQAHNRRNACDGSFDAFCTESCYRSVMS